MESRINLRNRVFRNIFFLNKTIKQVAEEFQLHEDTVSYFYADARKSFIELDNTNIKISIMREIEKDLFNAIERKNLEGETQEIKLLIAEKEKEYLYFQVYNN